MNIYISGSSSILASALIEKYFRAGDTLFLNDQLPVKGEDVSTFLEKKTGGQSMDLVFLLHGEAFLNGSLSRHNLRKRTRQHILYNTGASRYFAAQTQKPQTIVLESSVLIYQPADNEMSVENSRIGRDFPADFFEQMEKTTQVAEESGIRVLHLRLGKLVSKTAAPAFPRIALMQQYIPAVFQETQCKVSWVSLEDALRAIAYILEDMTISSPVNITSGDILPRPEFYKIAAGKFNLYRTIRFPSTIIRSLFGTEAAGLLRASAKAIPMKLMESGFLFRDISLQEYLQEAGNLSSVA
jgi:hypothetical protein